MRHIQYKGNFLQKKCIAIVVFMTMVFSSGCTTDLEDPLMDFVGDSIVARWDVNQDFPSYYVYNYGVGGSGIKLLESYGSKFSGKDIVVISGTNDNHRFIAERRDEYVREYVSVILGMTDKRIFLFSVLPRDFPGDRPEVNNDIEAFNSAVRSQVEKVGRVTYLDVFHEFMDAGSIRHEYFSDGLHPNSIGYEILTQKLLKAI